MWKVTCQFHTYLWAFSYGPGMMLSVKLSEFLVKIIDNGLSSGNFPRPTWLFVKMVLVTNWLVHLLLTKTFYSPSSLYFIFFSDKKKIMWSAPRTDLWQRVKGPSSFPALLCRSCATLGSSRCLWFSVLPPGNWDEMMAEISSSSQGTTQKCWLFCSIQACLFTLSIHELQFSLKMGTFTSSNKDLLFISIRLG